MKEGFEDITQIEFQVNEARLCPLSLAELTVLLVNSSAVMRSSADCGAGTGFDVCVELA